MRHVIGEAEVMWALVDGDDIVEFLGTESGELVEQSVSEFCEY